MNTISYIQEVFADHSPEQVLVIGSLTLDAHLGFVSVKDGPQVQLMPMETKLLAALILAPRGLLTRAAAFDALYRDRGDDGEPLHGALDFWLHMLRAKLKKVGHGITNIRGRGWQLHVGNG